MKMPPRKRRKSPFEESDSQCSLNEEENTGNNTSDYRGQSCPKRKQSTEDQCIIISDNEGEEINDEKKLVKKTVQTSDRRRTSVKRRIAQMTEEEQLALAVRMSEHEANHMNYCQEKEEEFLRKAIEESLHSCTVSAPSNTTAALKTNDLQPSQKLVDELLGEQLLTQNSVVSPNKIKIHEVNKELYSQDHVNTQDHLEEQFMSQRSAASETSSKSLKQEFNYKTYSFKGTGEDVEEKSLPMNSLPSNENKSRSPVVLLTRLSQDIVESNSVILSPNCKTVFSGMESGTVSSCVSENSDYGSISPNKALALSPVFPNQSIHKLSLAPRRLFQGLNQNSLQVQEMDDQCSHCSESSELDSSPTLPNSPLPQSLKNENATNKERKMDKNYLCNGKTTETENIAGSDHSPGKSKDTVHYYWGVPFCPKGEDPNLYTQVILCQLEVYEKSLKKAQRQLLTKMDFGEPVELSAPSLRRSERGKGDRRGSFSQASEDSKGEVPSRPVDGESMDEEVSDTIENRPVLSRKRQLPESPAHIQEEENSVPKQDEPEDGNSQTLCANTIPETGIAPESVFESIVSPASEENIVAEQIDDVHKEENTVCQESQLSPAKEETCDLEEADLPEIHSMSSPGLSSVPPTEESEGIGPNYPQGVECPLCGQQFLSAQIEMHAAYCDGTSNTDKKEKIALRSGSKLQSKELNCSGDLVHSLDSGKAEKCYICKLQVPLRDYKNHVENCLQSAKQQSHSRRNIRNTRETTRQEGRLLSMLERAESMSTEAHSSAPGSSYNSYSPPRNEDHVLSSISESPIKAFVSISEAKDCLVDFKQQFKHKSSIKGPRRSLRGRHKKF
ncbi:hypothetical protein GDO86_005560 [Hymenochirus boettgeri]|uniref:BRCA1-A complex subunit RAP80 n=1 Tax=Hymenochirus boettgeri TaxID=247094 RepID=A0A8T2J9T5_9PIPI|nr:hypothetical protein GDO86_005560 [Hymenochirus boettgeri]